MIKTPAKTNRMIQRYPFTFALALLILVLLGVAILRATQGTLVFNSKGSFLGLANQGTPIAGKLVITFNTTNYNDVIGELAGTQLPYSILSDQGTSNTYVFQVDVKPGDEQTWINKFNGMNNVVSAKIMYAN